MKTRIAHGAPSRSSGSPTPPARARTPSSAPPSSPPTRPAPRSAEWLLRCGARDLLVLPEEARAPQRVLIHWIGEAARSATLAVSASVLRHVPAEAVYVGVFPEPAGGRAPAGHARAARCALGSAGRARPGDAHRAAFRRRRAAARAAPGRKSRADAHHRRRHARAVHRALPRAARGRPLAGADRSPGRRRELPAAEQPAGLRAHLRLHDGLPEHHRAAAARRARGHGHLDCPGATSGIRC